MSKIKHKIIIGAHVSAAGGIQNSIENAQRIGVEAIQIHGSSPRQWLVRQPAPENIEAYKKALKESGISQVFLHAPYLANLASPNIELRKKSIEALVEHMNIAESMEATGLIFHVGSAGPEGSKEKAIHNTIQGMRKVLKNAPGKTYLILENGSGGGGKIGTTLQELSTIIKGVGSPRVKVCLDTAHIWGAGLLNFSPQGITTFFDEAEKKLGKNRIVVLHANDSKVEFGSMKDRHENIGEGAIGLEGFKNLAKEKRIATLPWILEVPGFEGKGPDKKNVQRLNSVFK